MRILRRLSIVHQVWLLLWVAVVLSVLMVGGAVAWNLRSGFGDYLNARDQQQMERLARLVADKAANDPTLEWLRHNSQAMRDLLDEFSRREGLAPQLAPGQAEPPMGGTRAPMGGPSGSPGGPGTPDGPAVIRRGPPGGLIGPRTQIYDADGLWVAGRGQPAGVPVLQEPVQVGGHVVAWVRVTQELEHEGVDARFLRRQYLGLAAATGLAVVVSMLLGAWVARRWSQPLRQLQATTQRLAQGEFAERAALDGGAREILDLTHNINQMAQSLQHLEQSRRAWIAQIAHELRTPLAVLLGEIESMEDGVRQATAATLGSLKEEVVQLTRLVNDLHTLSVADMGALPCEFLEGDATAPLLRVAQRFETRLAQHGLSLHTHGPSPVPACWDAGRIEQLMVNLLENALRYTHAPGRVQVIWEAAVLDGADALRIQVDDTAPGVSERDLPMLFEPLFRADASRQRLTAAHASGLGLAIVRAIVLAHGGQVQVRASPLGGLQVELVLPLWAPGTS
jgi:two-component system, OmpR family, sensor histidine kinase BaeS